MKLCVWGLAAATLLSSNGSAQAGLLDCLVSRPQQQPVVVLQQPAQQPAQSGLAEILIPIAANLLFGKDNVLNIKPIDLGSNSGNSESIKRANDTLDRIDGKLAKLEELMSKKVTAIETDLANLTKAHNESVTATDRRLTALAGDVSLATTTAQKSSEQVGRLGTMTQEIVDSAKFAQREADAVLLILANSNPEKKTISEVLTMSTFPLRLNEAVPVPKDQEIMTYGESETGKTVVKFGSKVGLVETAKIK